MGKLIGIAILLSAALAAFPAFAQGPNQNKGQAFVDAIRKEDGSTAFQILGENPTAVNTRDSNGDTALHITLRRSERDWAGYLIRAGADIELAGSNGDTPIIAAARSGFVEGIRWLTKRGAKIDSANKLGETALIVAVQTRNVRVLNALLEAGADPDKNDYSGHSARDYARIDTRSRELAQLIEAKKPKK